MRLRPALTVSLAAAALLAGLAWQAGGDRPVAAPPAVAALALALPVSPAVALPVAGHPPPPAGRPPARPGVATAVVDLCGLGRMPAIHPAADEAGDDAHPLQALPDPLGREPLAAARAQLLAQLHQGDARGRVVALLLERPAPDDPAAHQAWAHALLQHAHASARPEALQWAEPACAAQPDPAACRLSLVRARLRVEPDNAAHWAALADEDPGAADEAWHGLTQARHWQERPQALLLATQAALPAALPGYLRLALGAEMQRRTAPQPAAGEGFLLQRCHQPTPNRAQDCDALAKLLADRSDALRTLPQAAAVAQAAGWPAARVQQLHDEFRQLAHAAGQPHAGPQPLSCDRVQAWQQHLAEVARAGEPAALRARSRHAARP